MTIVGEHGRLRLFDDGLEWIGPDGKVIDSSRIAARTRGSAQAEEPSSAAARAIGEHIGLMLDPCAPAEAPSNFAAVLASAGAALLSARTGEGESPDTLLRMARSA